MKKYIATNQRLILFFELECNIFLTFLVKYLFTNVTNGTFLRIIYYSYFNRNVR